MFKVSIIIPCFLIDEQLKSLTSQCIKNIKKQTKGNYEIIIVNNGSLPKYNKFLFSLADIYVANLKNKGNAVAWNQGVQLARGEYLVFMDNDVKVQKGWLEPLLKILNRQDVGAALPISKCKEDINYQQRLDGFCWAIRKEIFDEIGGVSEEYGLAYFEDTDFWMQLQTAGYKVVSVEKSKVKHYSRATADKMPWLKALYIRNKDKFEKKWFYKYPCIDEVIY
jgi:GT2 family glycosyltransferase